MDNRKVYKYCSCLMKVRGKNTTFKNKRKKKSKTKEVGVLFNPYGICKASVMRGMSPKKNIPCGRIYDFNRYTKRQLKAYALEKHLPLRHKGKPLTKKMLITRLRNKEKRKKKKVN